jgi:hypothetical protein
VWAKIDDQFYLGKKAARIDRDEQDLYLASLVYCNGQLTDGFVPEANLMLLYVWAKLPMTANAQASAQAIASRLVEHDLWELVDDGFQVHDFLDWNPSRAEVLALKAARSEAGKRGGQHSRANAQANAQASAQAKPKQNPTPSPSPSPSQEIGNPSPPFQAIAGNGTGRSYAEKMQALNDKLGPELRRMLADAILKITGEYDLANTETDAGTQALYAAHEAAVAVYQMGYKSAEDLMIAEDDWYANDFRGQRHERPLLTQFLKQASKCKADPHEVKPFAVEEWR